MWPCHLVKHRIKENAFAMKLSILKSVALFVVALLLTAAAPPNDPREEIRDVIQAQQDAWNRGDIDAFLNGYWRSEETIFVSGDEISRGWQTVLERYRKKYSDREKMGT